MPPRPLDADLDAPRAIVRAGLRAPRDDAPLPADPVARKRELNRRRCKRYRERRRAADPEWGTRKRAELDTLKRSGRTAGIPRFIAIDGESTTDPVTGDHRYVLLCASDGVNDWHIENREGLHTLEVLRFLWDLHAANRNAVFVCFGLGYDVNMFLRDVPHYVLKTLWKSHESGWYLRRIGHYVNFHWIPQKSFRASMGAKGSPDYRNVSVYEVFGFFQTSFLRALQDWNIPDRDGAIKRIERGKADRGGFQWSQINRVRRYCIAECRLLVDLMSELARVLRAADLTPRAWNGAGAIAAAMLSKEKSVIDNHRRDDQTPRLMRRPILCGYYGGRFEVFLQGEFPDAYSYDIRSAYPYAARRLPSLNGKWIRRHKYRADAEYALWHVEWETPVAVCPVMPFPFREKKRIAYPERGRGWYWSDEVAAAIELWGDRIRILDGWEYRPYTDELPFAFIDRVWELRKQAKAEGRAEQKAYKLGLNSLYGKLAQGVGYGDRPPRFRSFIWAGMITSNTRATLLRLAANDPEAVIATATDGILFTRPQPALDGMIGTELGELDYERVTDLFVAGSGLYQTANKTRRRGFLRVELDWKTIREGWRDRGVMYTYRSESRRFIGLGTALGRTDTWNVWGRWIETPRVLSMFPQTKFPASPSVPFDWLPSDWYGVNPVHWIPPSRMRGIESEPYTPKTDGVAPDEAGKRYVNGIEQPDLSSLFG